MEYLNIGTRVLQTYMGNLSVSVCEYSIETIMQHCVQGIRVCAVHVCDRQSEVGECAEGELKMYK